MSYMVARMQKMKADNLVGIGNHNQRKTDNHSNKDIDIERSHLNYDLVEGRTENYKADIQKFIDKNKSTSRAVRKDAVLVNEWIITSDSPFFKDKDDKETERFFEESKDYFADKFGDKNIRYAQVHLDETTPHMHLGVVPFDKDKKLSAKRVFGRQTLRDVQDDLPRFLNKQGFSIERGEKGSERKNLTVPEYKKMKGDLEELKTSKRTLSDELTDANKELDQKKEQIISLTKKGNITVNDKGLGVKRETKNVKVPSGETIGKGKLSYEFKKTIEKNTGNVVMPEKNYLKLKADLEEMETTKRSVKSYMDTDLVHENKHFINRFIEVRDGLEDTKSENLSLKNENNYLKEKVKSLKNEIKNIFQSVKSLLKMNTSSLERAKELSKELVSEITRNGSSDEYERLDKQENKQKKSRSRGPRM